MTVFDSGVRKPPVAGSPEARRTLRIVSAEPGAPVWWAQRGSPGLLSRASTVRGTPARAVLSPRERHVEPALGAAAVPACSVAG